MLRSVWGAHGRSVAMVAACTYLCSAQYTPILQSCLMFCSTRTSCGKGFALKV